MFGASGATPDAPPTREPSAARGRPGLPTLGPEGQTAGGRIRPGVDQPPERPGTAPRSGHSTVFSSSTAAGGSCQVRPQSSQRCGAGWPGGSVHSHSSSFRAVAAPQPVIVRFNTRSVESQRVTRFVHVLFMNSWTPAEGVEELLHRAADPASTICSPSDFPEVDPADPRDEKAIGPRRSTCWALVTHSELSHL